VGREQLKRLPEFVMRRRELAAAYAKLLADNPGVRLPYEPEWARTNWQSYCVRLTGTCDQRTVMQAMLDAGVSTRRGIMCSHREPAYADHSPRYALAHSEQAQDECMLLPLFHQMTDDDQRQVVAALGDALRTIRNSW